MASDCVPESGGRWAGSGQKRAVRVYLIRFIYVMREGVPSIF